MKTIKLFFTVAILLVTVSIANAQTELLTVQDNDKIIHLDKIQSLVAAVGHDTEKVRANDVVYNALPDCCRYPRKS
jgi:hypothetical protein